MDLLTVDIFTNGAAIMVAVVVIFCFVLGRFLPEFKGAHDIPAGLMLHLSETKKWPIGVWAWLWVGLALALGVVLPIILDKDNNNLNWLLSLNGVPILNTLN